MTTHPEDADDWFVNLETLADRVNRNERHYRQNFRRIRILAAFVLFAFLLLAWRSEVNASRIERQGQIIADESRRISTTQDEVCAGSRDILVKFNTLQDELSRIERSEMTDNPTRDARIVAYEKARILPLPQCRGRVAR